MKKKAQGLQNMDAELHADQENTEGPGHHSGSGFMFL
jgi:hypothetical protein